MPPRPGNRRRVRAPLLAPDGSAFQKWENFFKTREAEEAINVDRLGFEAWKKMSKEERQPYLDQATKIDLAYKEELLQEIHETSEMEDEADSVMVGRVDQFHERCDEELTTPKASFLLQVLTQLTGWYGPHGIEDK